MPFQKMTHLPAAFGGNTPAARHVTRMTHVPAAFGAPPARPVVPEHARGDGPRTRPLPGNPIESRGFAPAASPNGAGAYPDVTPSLIGVARRYPTVIGGAACGGDCGCTGCGGRLGAESRIPLHHGGPHFTDPAHILDPRHQAALGDPWDTPPIHGADWWRYFRCGFGLDAMCHICAARGGQCGEVLLPVRPSDTWEVFCVLPGQSEAEAAAAACRRVGLSAGQCAIPLPTRAPKFRHYCDYPYLRYPHTFP